MKDLNETMAANQHIDCQQNKTQTNKKQELIRFFKFLAFSLSAGVIQLGSFEILYHLIGWNNWWATYLISITLSVIWNFTFNRKFTFKSASNVPLAMGLVLIYYAVFIPISTFGGDALEAAGWHETLVTVLMMILNFVTEFFYDRYVVFRNSLNTNNLAKVKIKNAIIQMGQTKLVKKSLQNLKLPENIVVEKIYKKEI